MSRNFKKQLSKGIGAIISGPCGSGKAKEMLVYTSNDEEESTEEKDVNFRRGTSVDKQL